MAGPRILSLHQHRPPASTAIHSDVYKWFNISFDHFGRTSTAEQTAVAQDIFWKCHKNDYVIQKVRRLRCLLHRPFQRHTIQSPWTKADAARCF
jgi:hypothetical protein